MRGKRKKRKEGVDYTQKAYMGIRKMFFVNEIVPGQKISYRDLAERLKMSATPIIQALKRLEFQGLVRHEPNRGFYTEEISAKEIDEIYELRELIEVSLLAKTIRRIDNKGLAKLEKALLEHRSAVREVYIKERLLKDMQFHLTLASLSDCGVQLQTLQNLFDLLYLKYRGNLLFVTPMETVDRDHQLIFDHVKNRHIDGARDVLARHISLVREHALASTWKMLREKENFDV